MERVNSPVTGDGAVQCASAQEVVDEKGLTVLQDALAVIDVRPPCI